MRARGGWLALVATAVTVVASMAPVAAAAAPPATKATKATKATTGPAPTVIDDAATIAAAAALPPGSTAAPVNPAPVTLVQPDGSTFTAVPWGDGLSHGYQTEAGYTVTRRADGTWVYATTVHGSGLVAGTQTVGTTPPSGLTRHLQPVRPAPGVATEHPTNDTSQKTTGAAGAVTNSSPGEPHSGPAKTIVILARFQDQASVGTTPAQWASRYFGASSSVKDYYAKNSYGSLAVAPGAEISGTANDGVIGWLSLARNHPNSQAITSDVVSVAKSAIVAANPFIDYAAFDTDGDGAISTHELHIVVIAAGYEGAYGGDAACGKALWGHRSAFGTAPSLDGVAVGSYELDGGYMMFGEQHCESGNPGGTHMATIGIMVHEFGHDLGLPDLYPSASEGGGVGVYSLMAYGPWLGSEAALGDDPSMLDAFSRLYEGWSTATALHGSGQVVSVPAAETSSTVYRVMANPYGIDWKSGISGNQLGMGEYYLIENRTNTGYDADLPGCGILIWHIDESRPTDWPNDSTDHFLIELEQADGFADIEAGLNRGDDGDPFPGSSGTTSFGPATNPGSNLSNGMPGTVSVTVPAGSCTVSKSITVTSPSSDIPPNDSWTTPVHLATASGSVPGNSAAATADGSEPAVPDGLGGASVWFTYTAASSGVLSLDTAGSSFDTVLGVYTHGGSGFTTLAIDDDAVADDPTAAIYGVPVTAGTTYYLSVDGFDDGARIGQGPYRLTFGLDAGSSPAPFSAYSALVKRQYHDLAGITPASAQVTKWVNRIVAKPSDRYQLISDLRTGADGTGSVDPVARLYRAYFLRDPDVGGFQHWVAKKRTGATVSSISSTFAGSSEFKSRYGSLSNQAFVNLIYQNVLGRPGESSGISYWTNQLNAKMKNRGQVMAGFSESSEFKRTSKPSIDLSVITLSMLGRRPNGPDIAYWRSQDELGRQSDLALARWVLANPEYEQVLMAL